MLTVGLYGIKDVSHGGQPKFVHDHSVAVMRDGRVVDVVSLERRTRIKHDNRLDEHFTRILKEFETDEPMRFVSVNAFVGSSFQSADGRFRIEPTQPVAIDSEPGVGKVSWWPDGNNRRDASGWVLCHEFAHIASILPFVGAFEPNSLLVHIDGGASESACTAWLWDGASAQLIDASWDLLKEPVNNFNASPIARLALGLSAEDHLAMPGKLMGYAGHGKADNELHKWLIENHFFLGIDDESVRAVLNQKFGSNPPYPALAATIQADFEKRVIEAIHRWQAHTGARHLYYTGGGALNIPTNSILEGSGRFTSIHVPPCPNDTGLAIGAAAWIEFQERGCVERHGPFLLKADLGEPRLDHVDEIARRLVAGDILGLCNGNAEVGPRALGHRSIIARPDSIPIRRRVSEQIKRREPYRPVAPAVLPEVAKLAFGQNVESSKLSPFMLGAWPLREGWTERFRGVVHADGTLRAQVVKDDSFLLSLLRRLWTQHGVAGLINTSFNGPGEPMVHTSADAIECARRIGLDGVIIDGSLHKPCTA